MVSREASVLVSTPRATSRTRLRALHAARVPIVAIALAAASADAQQAAVPAGSQQAIAADRGRPLEGRWKVELVLDPLSMTNPPPAERVDGELAFGSTSWWTNTDRFGRHSLDTRPFFGRLYAAPQNVAAFGPADTSMFTEITGGVIGDSVGIDFLPRIDHGGISLWGRFYGDSARGVWHRRGTEGSGRFVMRRVSSGAVAVAAIPVPSAAPAVAVASTEPSTKGAKGAKGRTKKGAKADAKTATTVAASAPAKSGTTTVASSQPSTPAPVAARPATIAAAPTSASSTPVTTLSASAPATSSSKPGTASTSSATLPTPPKPAATLASSTAATTSSTTGTTSSSSSPLTTSSTAAPTPSTAASSPPPAASPSTATSTAAKAPAPNTMRVSRTAPPDPSATGALRVRMFDRASKKYFVTRYQLHLPDGTFRWGNFRSGSGDEGFGPVVPSRPGRYEIEVENFVCGDKFWFFANKVVRPVVVKAGETTDVTIELDLTSEPARKTIDNKTGALCAAPPGDAK